MTDDTSTPKPGVARPMADRRLPHTDRRAYWRGGRRADDWPSTLVGPPACPRCQTREVGLIEATPDTLFWSCRVCQHHWESDRTGIARLG